MHTRTRLASLTILVLLAGCRGEQPMESSAPSSVGGTRLEPGFNLMKPQQDIEIGKKSAQQVEEQLPLVNDSAVTEYVSTLGAKLAANAPGYKFPYEFHVVNASDLNAFALPGGVIFINRGVLEAAKSEGEVAGVLAHEISHVALRHGTHQVSKAYLTQAGIGILGGILGGHMGRGTASIINVLGGFGLNALFLKNSRTAESEADVEGVQILARSGYDPNDMVHFFQTLEKVDKRRTINWLSDHPAPARRIQRIEQEAKLVKSSSPGSADNSGLVAIQSRFQQMPAGQTMSAMTQERDSGGASRRGGTMPVVHVDPPSSTLQAYTSSKGAYAIEYPSNWKSYDDGQTGVTFAPPGGAGDVNGATEIVYGAIVNRYRPMSEETQKRKMDQGRITVQDASTDLIAQVRTTSPYLKPGEGEAVADGLVTRLRGKDPATGIDEEVRAVVKQGPAGFVFMLFVTPQSASSSYEPLFSQMTSSLHETGASPSPEGW